MESPLPTPVELYNTREFDLPLDQQKLNLIASHISDHEEIEIELIEVVYVDEEEIIRINQEYLNRNYITDIISFSYHESGNPIEGTLYCCAPRILEQALELGESPDREFARIFIHGLLHLAGYDDKSESERKEMTVLEDKYLSASGY